MADHRDLVSSEVHEPRHISDSTSADSGKVITPLSAGASTLRYLTPTEVGVKYVYGEAGADANTTAFSVTAATDPELYTVADYVALNSSRLPGAALGISSNVTFDGAANSLMPSITGDYTIRFWMNVKSSLANSKIGVKTSKGSGFDTFTVIQDVKDAGRTINVSGTAASNLIAGDPISLYIACDKSASLTVQDVRMYIELVKEG